jgi:hypothetical protein
VKLLKSSTSLGWKGVQSPILKPLPDISMPSPTIETYGISVSIGWVSPPLSSAFFYYLYALAASVAAFSAYSVVASLATSSFRLISSSFRLISRFAIAFAYTLAFALALSASIFCFFFDASFFFFSTFSVSLLFLSVGASSTSFVDPECIEVEVWGDCSASSSSTFFLASSLAFS